MYNIVQIPLRGPDQTSATKSVGSARILSGRVRPSPVRVRAVEFGTVPARLCRR